MLGKTEKIRVCRHINGCLPIRCPFPDDEAGGLNFDYKYSHIKLFWHKNSGNISNLLKIKNLVFRFYDKLTTNEKERVKQKKYQLRSWYFLLCQIGVLNMREGILIPDMQNGRADIRFSSDNCYGGLHCGTTMDIWLNERWGSHPH